MSDLRRNIEYEVSQSSIQKAVQSLQKIRKEEENLAKQVTAADKASVAHIKALGKSEKEQKQAAAAAARLADELRKQGNDTVQATRALEDYERQIRDVKAAGADFGGDSASFLAGTRGGLSALTGGNLGGLGTGLEKLEGVADLVEFLPQLNVQFEAVGNVMRATDGITGKAVTGIGNMVSGVTGLSAGVSSFAVVALPVVATLGALALATHSFNKTLQEQKQAIQANIDALVQYNRDIAQGLTTEEAQAQLAELTRLREADTASLDVLNNMYAENLELFNDSPPVLREIGLAVNQFLGIGKNYKDTINELNTGMVTSDATIRQLEQGLERNAYAANDAAAAEEKLADERENSIRQSEQFLARAQQLQQQYADIVENNAIAANNAAEIEAVQSAIDNQNEQIAEKKHQDALAKIRTDGQARIEAITAELDSLPGERIAELAKVQAAGNEKITDLQDEYQKSTLQKYEDFANRLDKSTSDAAKSIARLARDIKDTLTDATLENDVASFLKAQRDGEKRLKDTRQDAQQQQKEMVDDFLLAQERERQAYLDKQVAIHEAIADEQRAVMQTYNERRQALETQRQQEQQAIGERIAAERQRHAEQLEQARIRDQQQAQLQAVRDKQQQDAYNRQLQNIASLQAAETSKYNLELAKINQVSAAIASIRVPSGNSLNFGGSGQTPISKGTRNNPRGNTNIFSQTNNNNVTVGDIASTKQVEEVLDKTVKELTSQQNALLHGIKNGRIR